MAAFVNCIKDRFTKDILAGKPKISMKIPSHKERQCLDSLENKRNLRYTIQVDEFKKLWNTMVEYFKKHDIEISITIEPDGMEMDSWHVVYAKPL